MARSASSSAFGSFADFKTKFAQAGVTRFGSGWAWLLMQGRQASHRLHPQSGQSGDGRRKPVMGLDVWEHAYYLKYQNRRPDYIEAWWNVVNWEGDREESGRREIVLKTNGPPRLLNKHQPGRAIYLAA